MKSIKPYWIVKIISHDEWSGPEVQDVVAFSDEDHALAIDYVRLLRYYSKDMSKEFYWSVDEPAIHYAHGLLLADDEIVGYNGPDYYTHLMKFMNDETDWRLPSSIPS